MVQANDVPAAIQGCVRFPAPLHGPDADFDCDAQVHEKDPARFRAAVATQGQALSGGSPVQVIGITCTATLSLRECIVRRPKGCQIAMSSLYNIHCASTPGGPAQDPASSRMRVWRRHQKTSLARGQFSSECPNAVTKCASDRPGQYKEGKKTHLHNHHTTPGCRSGRWSTPPSLATLSVLQVVCETLLRIPNRLRSSESMSAGRIRAGTSPKPNSRVGHESRAWPASPHISHPELTAGVGVAPPCLAAKARSASSSDSISSSR